MDQNLTRLISLVLLFIFAWTMPSQAQTYTIQTVPNPKQSRSSHYVSNPDRILSASAVRQIDSLLDRLEDSTTVQVAVVCLNSIGENVPKDFATALFRKWGLGYQKKNNGLLVLLVNDQHRIEMETGYGLEGILPDAICKRIQNQNMIPLAKTGDFDGAMIAGTQAIVHLISQPEAAQEVYDPSKYTSAPNQPLDSYGVFVLFLLLIPCLLVLRLGRFFLKKSNPIADQIETTISKAKGRLVWAFLSYVGLPIGIGLLVIQLREPLSLHGWQILLVMYACVGVIMWDAQRRRRNVFISLYGSMSEPERYVRLKAAGFNEWGSILLFPVPFGWFKHEDNKILDALRNHARQSADGAKLTKLEDAHKNAFLTDYQQIEDQLGTVDYDVWRNEVRDITQAIGYENLNDKTYQRCTKCVAKALYMTGSRIVKKATTEREGRGINDYECKACGYHKETQYTIPIIQQSAPSSTHSSTTYSSSGSSSSSWGGSSSGGSSSSSSWGGGSSGGGGAGSSW